MPQDPFEREKPFVEHLMRWVTPPAIEYRNPNADAGHETGADVLVVLADLGKRKVVAANWGRSLLQSISR